MSKDSVRKHVAEINGSSEDQTAREERHEQYAPPETVRVGSAKEMTQGNSTNRLDGYYGPGWTQWW